MNRNNIFWILLIFVGFVMGYIGGMGLNDPSQQDELKIVESTTSIGAVDENDPRIQIYSYNFTLYNGRDEEIYLDSIEPLFNEGISNRLLTDDPKLSSNKIIDPKSSIQFDGQVQFNATDLSKEEIIALEPFIIGVNISSTKTLFFP